MSDLSFTVGRKLKFAANLSFLYTEFELIQRFEAAARDGFKGVELAFPYVYEASILKETLRNFDLVQVAINMPPGGFETASMSLALDRGEKGTACIPGRETEFQAGFLLALKYAVIMGCDKIHAMAGLVPRGSDPETLRATYIKNLSWAAAQAEGAGVSVLIEPLNSTDAPGFYLSTQQQAHGIVAEVLLR
jgi:hydroxypyruvate isomerase